MSRMAKNIQVNFRDCTKPRFQTATEAIIALHAIDSAESTVNY